MHALGDALLGALALGDIGQHFPATCQRYKGSNSRQLLRQIHQLLKAREYKLNNADLTILAQTPKLTPYIPKMRQHLAADLDTFIDNISIKATTTEYLGYIGREEGIMASAVATLIKVK